MRTSLTMMVLSFSAAMSLADPIRWRLLSDNVGYPGPALPTGITYTWDKPATNPPDVLPGTDQPGRRLLDGDRPTADWNTTTGFNWEDWGVTFDLQQPYLVTKLRLRFQHQARPEYVQVLGSAEVAPEGAEPQYTELARLSPVEEGWNEIYLDPPREVRLVRLFLKLHEWGIYFREAQIFGMKPGEEPEKPLPTRREGEALVLTEGGQAFSSVVVDQDAPLHVRNAAWELKTYLERISGATVPIYDIREPTGGTRLIVGANDMAAQRGVTVPQHPLAHEGFVLRTVGNDLILAGNDAGAFQGTAMAVAHFLERLGVGWYGPDPLWEVIPKQERILVPPLEVTERPAVAMRQIWMVSGSLATHWGLGGVSVASGHHHSGIAPPDPFFTTHPEFFSLRDGRRTVEGEWQLCTTNPELIAWTIAQARAAFDRNPALLAYSLSPNDCGGFCQCPRCTALCGDSASERMLYYANAVARGVRQTHPDRYVCFLAYWYTFTAPGEDWKAEPGVIVMVVNEGCHAHALDDPTCHAEGYRHNVMWCRNFEAWRATGAEMAIYEWYIPGCKDKRWLKIPWVPGEVSARNVRWWHDHGVRWITYESQPSYTPGFPLSWPLFYVAARCLWNPDLTARALLQEACQQLYGPAAAPMQAYYAGLERALAEGSLHSGIWNLPDPTQVFTPDVRAQLRTHLGHALAAAGEADRAVWERVATTVAEWQAAEETIAPEESR